MSCCSILMLALWRFHPNIKDLKILGLVVDFVVPLTLMFPFYFYHLFLPVDGYVLETSVREGFGCFKGDVKEHSRQQGTLRFFSRYQIV